MVQVGERPFLSYLLWHAGRFGFNRVLLLSGHRAEVIREHSQDLAPPGVEVEVVAEPRPLGTAGALRFAADRLDDRVLFMNGDSLFDFNWLELLTVDDGQAAVVLSLRRESDASRFGVVETASEQVTGFRERGDETGGLINGGVYLLRRCVADACPQEGSFERDMLPKLAAKGRVRSREARGFFIDIGVPESLNHAQTIVPDSLRRPAVFFDRGALLNEEGDPRRQLENLRWMAGAAEAVKAVNDLGWFAFLITGPANFSQGSQGEAEMQELSSQMQIELRCQGAHFDAVAPPYTGPNDHGRPAARVLLDLLATWPIDVSRSMMISTHSSDVAAAVAAGIEGGPPHGCALSPRLKLLLA